MAIKKVLVIDDSKVAYHTLCKMLEERHMVVDWASSGEAGLSYLQDSAPDLIFLDIMLPGMDGFATARAIRAAEQISDSASSDKPPIIICSSSAAETNQPSDFNAAQAFLIKPYNAQDLDAALRRVGGREAAPQHQPANHSKDAQSPAAEQPTTRTRTPIQANTKSSVGVGAAKPARNHTAAETNKAAGSARSKAIESKPPSSDKNASSVGTPSELSAAVGDLLSERARDAATAVVDKRLDSIGDLLSAMSGQLNAVNLVLAEQRRERAAEPSPAAVGESVAVQQQIAIQVERALSARLADEQFHQLLQTLVMRAVAVQIDRVVQEAADTATQQIMQCWPMMERREQPPPVAEAVEPTPAATEQTPVRGTLRRLWSGRR